MKIASCIVLCHIICACVSLFMTGLMEMIHKAAFRDTLGHSLYMAENRIGSFTPENVTSLASYHNYSMLLSLVE